MKTVLATGVTGFLGSVLAARFLRCGHAVVALSRSDEKGERTLAKVREAASGLGEPLQPGDEQRLSVLPYDLEALDRQHRPAIDEIVENASTLTLEDVDQPQLCIVNAARTDQSNRDRRAIMGEGLGVTIEFGKPRTVGDHALATWTFVNQRFNNRPMPDLPFPFEQRNLEALLGRRYVARPVDGPALERIADWYAKHRLATVAERIPPAARLPVQAMRALHASGLERAMFAKEGTAKLPLGGIARAWLEA